MIIRRDIHLNRLKNRMHNGMIKVITGIRGSGKSFSGLFSGNICFAPESAGITLSAWILRPRETVPSAILTRFFAISTAI